jgi:adenosylcobinamide-phosphate synthase
MDFKHNLIFLIIAIVLDYLIGDPVYPFHPVRLIGFCINKMEKCFFSFKFSGYIGGGVLWISVIIISVSAYLAVNHLLFLIHPVISYLWQVYILYSFLSIKDLIVHGRRVYGVLKQGNLKLAREYVGLIVGRDTSQLTSNEIAQAAVESLSENSSDGIVGPIFFAIIGGPVGITVYKTISTMDSIIGYNNKKYFKFGFIAAKADDIVNLIPARITLFFILLSKIFNIGVWRLALENSRNHLSPNSGFCEAAIAALLNIRMGGTAFYKGIEVKRPIINKNGGTPAPDHIKITIDVINLFTVFIFFLIILMLVIL